MVQNKTPADKNLHVSRPTTQTLVRIASKLL